jgi:hypothetical protein
VRSDVGAVDVLMMVKGVCEATSSYQHVDPEIAMRQLDLVRAAISPREAQRPLRGHRPTIEEFERANDEQALRGREGAEVTAPEPVSMLAAEPDA